MVIKYKIKGMSCAGCAARIENELSKSKGINSAVVNFTISTLNLDYDDSTIKEKDIIKQIRSLGYDIDQNKDAKKISEQNILLIKLIISCVFVVPLLIISMGHMFGMPLPQIIDAHANPFNFGLIQAILTFAIIITGYKYYFRGFKNLFTLRPNMDSLIAVGTTSAVLYSLYSMYKIYSGNTEYAMNLYFESAGTILTLITLGKFLESVCKGKSSEAIKKLIGLSPKKALVIRNSKETEVDIDEVKIGDIIIVKPGEKFPVDGIVTEGVTSADESMLTGESLPVDKEVGSNIIGASINKSGYIKYKATKIGKDTALAQIIKLVEDAQGTKAPIARLADKISLYFVPTVIILAVLAAVGWLIAGETITFALKIFISVLVIACPCALGLATPTAIMVATGKGAQKGILIKNSASLENLGKINAVVFDKTGTLTQGKPVVTNIVTYGTYPQKELLSFAATAEKASEHSLGQAIINCANQKNIEYKELQSFNALTGHGLEATIDNKKIYIGNKELMFDKKINLEGFESQSNMLSNDGKTSVYIACEGQIIGLIAIADVLKEESAKTVKALQDMNIEVTMLTGDNERTARVIANSAGITNVVSQLLPADKSKVIKEIQSKGKLTAMAGDGINDAPALVQADIGIAVGSGTDVALESADIVLMHSNLTDILDAIRLSRATIKNIKYGLGWAFGYNIIGIPIAMGFLHIFGGPLLNPMIAALAMSFSSVSVLLNAMRLKKFK